MDEVPVPVAAETDYNIGAMYFPGWKPGHHIGWDKIKPFPRRKPLLGWYDESDPRVADWEIKWALEHGISFFAYCWYRGKNLGKPVRVEDLHLGHGLHEALFKSQYVDQFKFCIMWANHVPVVESLDDFKQHVIPFWINQYFLHGSYLKVHNKPILHIFDPWLLARDLGGIDAVKAAIEALNEACLKVGFDGAWTMARSQSFDRDELTNVKKMGFDYVFAYCWAPGFSETEPPPEQYPSRETAVRYQLDSMRRWQEMGILPFLPTATMGWDPKPWENAGCFWLRPENMLRFKLLPEDYRRVCEGVKEMMVEFPSTSLARRMLLLDNWNEWGEGHYISPHQEHGFDYLDVVRDVFTKAPIEHVDLRPEDVGMGPYGSEKTSSFSRFTKGGQRRVPGVGAS